MSLTERILELAKSKPAGGADSLDLLGELILYIWIRPLLTGCDC